MTSVKYIQVIKGLVGQFGFGYVNHMNIRGEDNCPH